MLAHHFPPAGGSGSNRALAFARYLPAFGWEPIVVTPGVEWAMHRDAELEGEIPSTVRVVRTRSFEPRPGHTPRPQAAIETWKPPKPTLLKSQLGHLRRFPDAHIGWLPFAVAAARGQRFDVAYSSSGPFTSHVAGLFVKRLTGKPWVVELRDGWYRWNRSIFPDYPAWRDALERRLEAAVIRTADRVVLVTERMADSFRDQYGDLAVDHFSVVSNGFDPSQFDDAPIQDKRAKTFVVLHAGALYYGRSLAAFLQGVRALAAVDSAFQADFVLRLLGTLDAAAQAEVARSGLSDCIEVLGHTSHAEAIAAMRSADALLLVANTTPGAEATVPGKLFEYLAVGRPVLAVAPRESATADVLRQTGGGWLADVSDVNSIACTLRRAYTDRTAAIDKNALEAFDRRRLTRDLAVVLDKISADATRRL